jgi:hypothetical protein
MEDKISETTNAIVEPSLSKIDKSTSNKKTIENTSQMSQMSQMSHMSKEETIENTSQMSQMSQMSHISKEETKNPIKSKKINIDLSKSLAKDISKSKSITIDMSKSIDTSKSKSKKLIPSEMNISISVSLNKNNLPFYGNNINMDNFIWNKSGLYTNGIYLPHHKKFKDYTVNEFIKKYSKKNSLKNLQEDIEKEYNVKIYQKFIADYMSPSSPVRGILLYHGLGVGKTKSAIEVCKQYRKYGIESVIIMPASLKANWINQIKEWDKELLYNKMDSFEEQKKEDKRYLKEVEKWYHFVSYNASNAVSQFRDIQLDGKLIIIDEVHNLISNFTSLSAKRTELYKVLLNTNAKIIAMTATPIINKPFELALLFNILKGKMTLDKDKKCTLFPETRLEFDTIFVDYNTKSPKNINLFQNRINGLVSYYFGSNKGGNFPDVINYPPINCIMSNIQLQHYLLVRKEEIEKEKIRAKFSGMKQNSQSIGDDFPSTYRSKSRQASDYVFPEEINRPTKKDFVNPINIKPKLSFNSIEWTEDQIKDLNKLFSNDEEQFISFKSTYAGSNGSSLTKLTFLYEILEKYSDNLESTKNLMTDGELEKLSEITVPTDYDEARLKVIELLTTKYSQYLNPNEDGKLYECSQKFKAMINNINEGPGHNGVIFVYSTFINMEGLDVFSKVLEYLGYEQLTSTTPVNSNKKRYLLYTGEIEADERAKLIKIFTSENNLHGEICKIFLGSAAAAEGLNLQYIQQVHVIEPHWHEVRIQQVIGRARRFNSHKLLPPEERKVHVFRYHSVLPSENEKDEIDATDLSIYNLSMQKLELNNKFNELLQSCAIDCKLHSVENNVECFDIVTQKDLLFNACIKNDKPDIETDKEFNIIEAIYKEISIAKTPYIVKMDKTGTNYEYSSVKKVSGNYKITYLYDPKEYKESNGKLIKIRALIEYEDGKKKIINLGGDTRS